MDNLYIVDCGGPSFLMIDEEKCLQLQTFFEKWRRVDLNHRPRDYEALALTA